MISSVISSGLSLMEFSMIDLLSVLLNPVAFITAVFYSISLLINGLIYSLAAYMYALFPAMCELDFSALTPQLQNIISRIEVFIGIFMLFIVAFNLLQYMVDPDKKEGATSKLITKIIVALILLVSSSFIFGILDELQIALVSRTKDNIAQTVLFGKTDETNGSDIETGRRIVYAVFFNMYENQAYGDKYGYDKEYNDLVSGESFWILIGHLWQTPETYARVYFHYPFLSEVFGLFLIILFATFTIDIGVRNITLLFLRILFPIAAIGYITPKGDNILSGYISTYMSTYVQVFVKTFIIYLLLYIFLWFMEALTTIDGALFKNSNLDDTSKTILLLLIVVALFMFFRKGLPAIMKKVFGVEMESSLGGIFGKALGIAAAGASLVAGGIFGGIMGAAGGAKGAALGALKGITGGAKAGWNAGKQVGSGNMGAAVAGYGKGMASTVSGAVQARKGYIEKKENLKKNEQSAVKAAQDAEQRYNAAEASFQNEAATLQGMAADDPNREMQQAKVNALAQQRLTAKQDAIDKMKVAKSLSPTYQSDAVKAAVETESNYSQKQSEYTALEREIQNMSSDSPERATKVAEATKLEQEVAQAKAEATAAAKEAKAFDSEYSSTAVKTAVEAESDYSQKQSAYVAAEKELQSMSVDSPEYSTKVAEVQTLKSEVEASKVKATNAAKEAVLWDDTYTSKLISTEHKEKGGGAPDRQEGGSGEEADTSGKPYNPQEAQNDMNEEHIHDAREKFDSQTPDEKENEAEEHEEIVKIDYPKEDPLETSYRELEEIAKSDETISSQWEVYESILTIAKGLIKEGYSPQDAYVAACRKYNNGE